MEIPPLDPAWAFALAVGLLLAMTLPGFVLYGLMLRRLRLRHPDTWQRLGRPGVIFYASLADRRALNRFVEAGEFEQLGDPPFARFCRFYRGYAHLYGAVFVAILVLFAVVWGMRALAGS